MAIGSYLVLTPYDAPALVTEEQVVPGFIEDLAGVAVAPGTLLEIDDYSLDVAQTLSIGSQSSGAGAGKITFDGFSIVKTIDILSPVLFGRCASGTAFAKLDLLITRPTGATPAGVLFLQYTFKLAAVRAISTGRNAESPAETVVFDYGDLQIRYAGQNPDGSMTAPVVAGWNRVQNVADVGTDLI